MRNFLRKKIYIPIFSRADSAIKKFTIGERALFFVFTAIFAFAGILLFVDANNAISISVPAKGGTISEGIIGTPRFINPILATSDADRDLSALVFSGLMRPTTKGNLVTDLASGYTISDDGLTYTVTIKDNAFFHDGVPITADDVIFTISKAQDPAIKSPRRAEWEGIAVEKIDDHTVTFHLPRPYYPFIENLTLGIIPKHLWSDLSGDEFVFSLKNITPIGSGPFKIDSVNKNNKDIPISYKMSSFSDYVGGGPYVQTFNIKLYPNENDLINAWEKGEIDSMGGISSNEAEALIEAGARVEHLNLPRVYAIFFNQNQYPTFADKAVREALAMVVDKNAIVENVLSGYGQTLDGPLPYPVNSDKSDILIANESATSTAAVVSRAKKILEKDGWTLNEKTGFYEKIQKATSKTPKSVTTLSFSLAAPNVPELKNVANMVAESWKTLGVSVEVKLFELSDLSQNVIRPRKYDTLLFGQVIGRNPDLFAFWDSSQRNDPGYNIALYTNSKVDKLLSAARSVKNQKDQDEIIQQIYSEINDDIPAIFLYTPDYLYVLPKESKGFEAGSIASPTERFADIAHWFINSEKVWEILAPKINNQKINN